MRLEWRESALEDVRIIFGYIAERDEKAAQLLMERINACAERLPDFPYLYRPGRSPGTREAVIHPNYLLIYKVVGDAVQVVAVTHARRKYP